MYEIYLTTNLINGKKYIGQHKLTKKYDYYLGSGKLLKRAIDKYGKHNFKKEILITCETAEEANKLEKEYIKKYNAVEDDQYYNLAEGGQEEASGFLLFREYLKSNPEIYKKYEEYRIKKLKEWQQEHHEIMSKNGKENIKKCHEWIQQHPEEMAKIYAQQTGETLKQWEKEHPEEAKANREKGKNALIEWNKEHPEEMKKNLALGPQANKEKNGKKVRCITTGKIFASIREAEAFYGIYKDGVGRCLRGVIKSAGKHPETKEKLYWEYYTEEV